MRTPAGLVLVDSETGESSLWGLVCPRCVSVYHGGLSVKTEREEPEATRALRDVFGRPPTNEDFESDKELYNALWRGVSK